MTKKSRVFSILAVILCLCLSGIIGYRGGHAIGLYFGQVEGYTAGYAEAIKRPTAPNIESVEGSIARRQANQDSAILPLDTCAFEPEYANFELTELKCWTGYDDFRSFYESFGITVTEESELNGWFKCQLPEGWSISYDDTPDRSHDESVRYVMPDGVEAFHIISHKNMTNYAASLAPNLDLF